MGPQVITGLTSFPLKQSILTWTLDLALKQRMARKKRGAKSWGYKADQSSVDFVAAEFFVGRFGKSFTRYMTIQHRGTVAPAFT